MKYAPAFALLLCVSCQQAPLPDACTDDNPCTLATPDSTRANTPRMGFVTATSGTQNLIWETYDFSVGAFDASAWMGRGDGNIRLSIRAFDPADESLNGAFRIDIRGYLPEIAPGPAWVELIEVVDLDRFADDGPRDRAMGDAELTVTSLTREGDDSYGQISGTFTGRFCRAAGANVLADASDCREVTGQFDTQVQFDGI